MASLVEVYCRISVSDPSGVVQNYELAPVRFTPGVGALPVVQEVSCTGSSFTALVIPAAAKLCLIRTGANPSLSIKADAGSTNIPITPATGVLGIDQVISLGANPALGIQNGGSTVTLPVVFF